MTHSPFFMARERRVSAIPLVRAVLTVCCLVCIPACERVKLTGLQPSQPAITLTASPSVIAAGQSTTLTWDATGASQVTIEPEVGVVYRELVNTPTIGSPRGSRPVRPAATVTYRATAWNAGAEATSSATITVTSPPPTVATLVGSFSFDSIGTEPYVQRVTFTGTLVSASGPAGETGFSVVGQAQVASNGIGVVPFTKGGLRPGIWTVTGSPIGGPGPKTCPNVHVPGVVRLSVAASLPGCG